MGAVQFGSRASGLHMYARRLSCWRVSIEGSVGSMIEHGMGSLPVYD
jgi:hypothetical protein